MSLLHKLRVKIFADGADFDGIMKMYENPLIKGFTTNPTLMRKAGITDYEAFARKLLAAIPDRPVSLEVFADDFDEMERQAKVIASWGKNVNVKIPVTNTKREFSGDLIRELSHKSTGLVRMIGPVVRFGRTPASVRHAGPGVGEYTGEILAKIGIGERKRRALIEAGVVK